MDKFSTFLNESSDSDGALIFKHNKTGEHHKYVMDGPKHWKEKYSGKRITGLRLLSTHTRVKT